MKKTLICTLALLSLVALAPPSAVAEGSAPGPTPPPAKVAEGGVPIHTRALQGVDAAQWKEAFLAYAEKHAVPVEEGGFEYVTEWPRREQYEMDASFGLPIGEEGLDSVDRMHRVMAGGAEVFVQVVDETTAVQFVVLLDYDATTSAEYASSLAYYYPLVMRACIFASEPGATEAEAARIQEALCPDIPWLMQNGREVKKAVAGNAALYFFGTNDFAPYGGYSIVTIGIWERVDTENWPLEEESAEGSNAARDAEENEIPYAYAGAAAQPAALE